MDSPPTPSSATPATPARLASPPAPDRAGVRVADPQAVVRTQRRRRKAPIAASLSFVFPGAGQLFNHQRRLAAAFAIPVVLLAVVLAGVVVVAPLSTVFSWLLDIRAIFALMGLNLVLLLWRLASMLQAHRYRARFRPGRVGSRVTALLVLVTIGMHTVPVIYGLKLVDTLSTVALGGDRELGEFGPRFPGFTVPSGTPETPQPRPPEIQSERVNILLVGLDSGPGRDHSLTDTMLVVSVDAGGESAMVSIPRDLVNAPLPSGEPYPLKLNSLLQNADADPERYPFGGGVATLKATIGGLLGVTIHYLAALDMAGFEQTINAVGGVEIIVDRPIADPQLNFYLDPGLTFMDGAVALQYARSRYGPGDDDFVRAARQQQLLTAVRDRLTSANLLATLPGLLDAVKNLIATDVPSDRIPELAEAIQDADMANVDRVVIQPPRYVTPATGADGAYVLLPDLELIRELGQDLLGP